MFLINKLFNIKYYILKIIIVDKNIYFYKNNLDVKPDNIFKNIKEELLWADFDVSTEVD